MEDIITALATAFGESGIAIVRLSGSGCVALADKILHGRHSLSSRLPRVMTLFNLSSNGMDYDEALVVRFEPGASYTGEESTEIQCHGGVLAAHKCIESLCALGARVAQPGEFTRRAFLNGKMDLSQAESILGIIKAKSDEALAASARTLQGRFTSEIHNFLSNLTKLAAQLEVDLDFPEEGQGLLTHSEFEALITHAISQCETIASQCRSGLLLSEGIKAAILGSPNVGKSSLLNALLKEERAIVTPIPGTTRDRIEETFTHKGVPVRIIDTAGIRETSDRVESIGVNAAMKLMEEADICLWVIDSSKPLGNCEKQLGSRITKQRCIAVLNKCDLPQETKAEQIESLFPATNALRVSSLTAEGIDQLKDRIINEASSGQGIMSESYGVTARQMECISNAADSLKDALRVSQNRLGDDVTASRVADARKDIANLLGLDASEDLLDNVFSKFCVGK